MGLKRLYNTRIKQLNGIIYESSQRTQQSRSFNVFAVHGKFKTC